MTEILVPAGYVQVAYDARFRLEDNCKSYAFIASEEPTFYLSLDCHSLWYLELSPGKRMWLYALHQVMRKHLGEGFPLLLSHKNIQQVAFNF